MSQHICVPEWTHWHSKFGDRPINLIDICTTFNNQKCSSCVREEHHVNCKAGAISNYNRGFLLSFSQHRVSRQLLVVMSSQYEQFPEEALRVPGCNKSKTHILIKKVKRKTTKMLNQILPEEMSSNNPILGLGLLPNQVQVNCGSVTCKNAVWWAIFFKIRKNLLLQRDILNNSLLETSRRTNYVT